MLLYSLIHTIIVLLYSWLNIWVLGYFGGFFIIIINILICLSLVTTEFYQIWLYCIDYDLIVFLWIEFGNNIFIFFNFKTDLFSYILSLIIFLGLFVVINFVFIDLYDDKEGINFIINLGFFGSFMLILTMGGNLLVFYLGWEGIGITSLILVSYWNERTRSIKAAFKIYLINKIGDYLIFFFICIILNLCGDIDFDVINSMSSLLINNYLYSSTINIIDFLGILLVLGASIKSAQFGFHVWLLEAMEAPLGASALMHSSTLVVSGFVLFFRLSSIIELSFYAQNLMFLMGSFSATFGALVSCFQYELKTIMAYSTISNMGYLFILFSFGAYYEAVFVLIIHAFIKIFMFLTVGSIIIYCQGCQDIRWMGGLLLYIPGLWVAYTFGGFCLIGLPYLSGYYCKQGILIVLSKSFVLFKGVENILMLSFFFTAIYITRSSYLIFLGSKNGHRKIYKKKIISWGCLLDLFFLSIVAIFCHFLILTLLDTSFQSIYNNMFSKSKKLINFDLLYIDFIYYYQWFFFYWLKILVFIYWCYILHYTKWNGFFYLHIFNCFIFIKFIIHTNFAPQTYYWTKRFIWFLLT